MKYVGKSVPIHDAIGKVTGGTRYAGDMQLPGMLYAALLTSDIPHGNVRNVWAERALQVPGVRDVLHCFNTTERRFSRYRSLSGREVPEQERVFTERIRFVGDRVACVIAETAEAAIRALPLLEVDVTPLPYATDVQTALETRALKELLAEGFVYPIEDREMGERPGAAGSISVETGGAMDRISHVAMEPQACVADYNRGTGEATVWSPNQSVYGLRTVLADLFDLPYHKLRVIKTTMGGSFGAKQEWMAEPVALAAALHMGRPVKLVFTREQAMLSSITRAPLEGRVTTTVTRTGKVLAVELDTTVDAGAYLGNSRDYCAAISDKISRFYSFPYTKHTGRAICTNSPVSGAFRGWGMPELYFLLEHNLNTAAKTLEMDPTEIRLLNAANAGDVDGFTGQPLADIQGKACILQGREQFNWESRREACKSFNSQNKRYRRGVGVGCAGHSNGVLAPGQPDFTGVEMRMAEDGSVTVKMSLHDHGSGAITAMKMMIADTLGISIEKIALGEADTATTPFDVGGVASRATYVNGQAVIDCAVKLKALLLEFAAELIGVSPDVLTIQDGMISPVKEKGPGISYAQIARESIAKLQREVWVTHQHQNRSNPGVTAAHFAHVEVDLWTGMVQVLDYLAVHDIGQVINREMAVAQVQGAVSMGMGAALTEAMTPNQKGRFTASLKKYALRNCPELPQVRVEFIEEGGAGPYGAKSLGELAVAPVAPTIVGAVNDALGSDLNQLPLNPERIVQHLQKGGVSWT